MKTRERIDRGVDRIMAELENIPREIPPPYLAERITAGLTDSKAGPSPRLMAGWLRPILIGAIVALNIFLCFFAIKTTGKALDLRETALDRLAAEYEMVAAADLFSNR